jgi:hypothetical protein
VSIFQNTDGQIREEVGTAEIVVGRKINFGSRSFWSDILRRNETKKAGNF